MIRIFSDNTWQQEFYSLARLELGINDIALLSFSPTMLSHLLVRPVDRITNKVAWEAAVGKNVDLFYPIKTGQVTPIGRFDLYGASSLRRQLGLDFAYEVICIPLNAIQFRFLGTATQEASKVLKVRIKADDYMELRNAICVGEEGLLPWWTSKSLTITSGSILDGQTGSIVAGLDTFSGILNVIDFSLVVNGQVIGTITNVDELTGQLLLGGQTVDTILSGWVALVPDTNLTFSLDNQTFVSILNLGTVYETGLDLFIKDERVIGTTAESYFTTSIKFLGEEYSVS